MLRDKDEHKVFITETSRGEAIAILVHEDLMKSGVLSKVFFRGLRVSDFPWIKSDIYMKGMLTLKGCDRKVRDMASAIKEFVV